MTKAHLQLSGFQAANVPLKLSCWLWVWSLQALPAGGNYL